jgi:hypothetical protein
LATLDTTLRFGAIHDFRGERRGAQRAKKLGRSWHTTSWEKTGTRREVQTIAW